MKVGSFGRDRRGGVALVFALSAPVLLAAAAAAVDYSDLSARRSQLQIVADGAAIAGAKALAQSQSTLAQKQEQDASAAAGKVAAAQAPAARATITPSALDGTVTVSLSLDKPLFFGGLLGSASKTVGVTAQATYSEPDTGCVLALGTNVPTGIDMVGSASIYAPTCGVRSNAKGPDSIAMQGAPKLTARNVCASGGTGKAKSSPPAKSGCAPVSDPYATRPLKCGKNQDVSCPVFAQAQAAGGKVVSTVTSTFSGLCDFTDKTIGASAKGIVSLLPGVYCGGLSIQSADVVLLPGFYQIQDGPLSLQGNATLRATGGVSILLSGTGAVLDLQGNPQIEIVAMTTGPLAGIAIASDTPASPTLTSKLQGSPDVTLTGSIWLPNQVLDLQGSPTLTLSGKSDKAVALAFSLQGSPDFIVKADDRNGLLAGSNLRLSH